MHNAMPRNNGPVLIDATPKLIDVRGHGISRDVQGQQDTEVQSLNRKRVDSHCHCHGKVCNQEEHS